MKKTYSKPQIVFEDFTLTTNIASDCEAIVTTPLKGVCGIDVGPFVVFLDNELSKCTGAGRVTDMGGDGQYQNLCYHVPTGEKNLFNS